MVVNHHAAAKIFRVRRHQHGRVKNHVCRQYPMLPPRVTQSGYMPIDFTKGYPLTFFSQDRDGLSEAQSWPGLPSLHFVFGLCLYVCSFVCESVLCVPEEARRGR